MEGNKFIAFEKKKALKEAKEHQDAVLALRNILETPYGKKLISYLFKNFEIGTIPDRGFEGLALHDYLGFLRAGNSIYKLACEANFEIAGSLIAKMEKEKYDELYEQYRLENAAANGE